MLRKVYSNWGLSVIVAALLILVVLGFGLAYMNIGASLNEDREADWNAASSRYRREFSRHQSKESDWQEGLDEISKETDVAAILAAELSPDDATAFMIQINRRNAPYDPSLDGHPMLGELNGYVRRIRARSQLSRSSIIWESLTHPRQQAIAEEEPYKSTMILANIDEAKKKIELEYVNTYPKPAFDLPVPGESKAMPIPSTNNLLWTCGTVLAIHFALVLSVQLVRGVRAP